MDLRGLDDKEWRGFSDKDIRRAQVSVEVIPTAAKTLHMAPNTPANGGHSLTTLKPPGQDSPTPPRQAPPRQDSHTPPRQAPPRHDSPIPAPPRHDSPTPPRQAPPSQLEESSPPNPVQPAEVQLGERPSHVQLEREERLQQRVKEDNEKKKKLVEKALVERYTLTQQESLRLKKIRAELASLDELVTRDVAVLRGKIETTSTLHNAARLRYEVAEKEFVLAKIDVQKKKEQKELLSEHLCTIIHTTELRKARKLAELCKSLGVE